MTKEEKLATFLNDLYKLTDGLETRATVIFCTAKVCTDISELRDFVKECHEVTRNTLT